VGKDVRADDLPVARSDHPGGLDELRLAQREHLRANDTCGLEPAEEGEDEEQRQHAAVEDPERDVV
jgi:hypothetical protein